MGVFQTKVYKECYPFSREVLYNTEKRKLIIHLLDMPYQCFQLFE